MRNQILMAERGHVRAATINSDNHDDWDAVEEAIVASDPDDQRRKFRELVDVFEKVCR